MPYIDTTEMLSTGVTELVHGYKSKSVGWVYLIVQKQGISVSLFVNKYEAVKMFSRYQL